MPSPEQTPPNPKPLTSARAFGPPVSTGITRQSAEDFVVTELLGFDLSGDGEHDFLYIEKTGANTNWVASALARHAQVSANDVGYGGLKDRHAVTRQWFSVRRPSGAGTDWNTLSLDNVRILETGRNQRKLRRGAHVANRFRIRIRSTDAAPAAFVERLQIIRQSGVPNYFGEQRFGREGGNLRLAAELFSGRRLKRDRRSIALSAARSCLFNEALSARVEDGSWERAVPGEVFNLDGSGSVFAPEGNSADIGQRLEDLDIHPTCVLWGRAGRDGDAALLEYDKSAAARHPVFARGLERAGLSMARRATRLNVRELCWTVEPGLVELRFELGRGGYATAVLRELIH